MSVRPPLFSILCLLILWNSKPAFAQSAVDSLNLHNVILAALDYNKSLQNSVLEIEKNKEIKKGIHHTYIPTLEAGGSYAYTAGQLNLSTQSFPVDVPGFSLPPVIPGFPPIEVPPLGLDVPPIDQNIDFNGNLWMGGLTAKWTLFTGLKAPYLSKAMKHKIKAQEQTYIQEEAELIAEVSHYYDKIALLEKTKLVLESQRIRLDKETQVAKKALELGLITRHEYQKIEIAQLALESKQLEYEGGKELLMLKLQQLTGISVASLSQIKVELYPRLKEYTEKTYLDRPELLALDEATLAIEYKYKSEISGYLPKIQAFATHQYAGLTNGSIGNLGFNEISAYPINAIGIGMKWELFDGLHTHNERQKVKIELEQTKNKKEEVKQLLALNYNNTVSQFKNLSAQTKLKEKQRQSAEKSLEISYKEYQNGLIQLSDFLEAQAHFTTMTLDYYQTVCDQRDSALELLKATGSLQIQKL